VGDGAIDRAAGMKGRRPDGIDPVLRSRARKRALQAVYAWQMNGGSADRVIEEFAHEQVREQADVAYFEDLLRGVIGKLADIDKALAPFLDRTVDQVDP